MHSPPEPDLPQNRKRSDGERVQFPIAPGEGGNPVSCVFSNYSG
jgi:hypothetical protein